LTIGPRVSKRMTTSQHQSLSLKALVEEPVALGVDRPSGARVAVQNLLKLCDEYSANAKLAGISPQGRSGRTDGGPGPTPPGALGQLRDDIFEQVESLSKQSPTLEPAKGLRLGSSSPLDGKWRLRFTTAADAKPPGVGETYQAINKGEITNVLEFPRPSPIERIEVRLEGEAKSPSRVGLLFDKVRTSWREPQWFTLWKRETEVSLPKPGTWIAEVLARLTNADRENGAHFEVLYLDDCLRVHKTAEGNLFIQSHIE